MSDKTVIVSYSVPGEVRDMIKKTAREKNMSSSKFVSELIEKFAPVMTYSNVVVAGLPDDVKLKITEMAGKLGVSEIDVLTLLINKHLALLDKTKETPIIFKVPSVLKGSEKEIYDWLIKRVEVVARTWK